MPFTILMMVEVSLSYPLVPNYSRGVLEVPAGTLMI